MRTGLDFAWKPWPPVSRIKGIGATFVVRYISSPNLSQDGKAFREGRQDTGKDLTPGEVALYSEHGIDICLVWETSANRAVAGRAAGKQDATYALKKAKALGMPDGRPIYFAVDFDAAPRSVFEYFRGILSVLPLKQVGVYGGYRVIESLHDNKLAFWCWQTLAWSGGKWSRHNHIEQYAIEIHEGSWDYDLNRSKAEDFGQWRLWKGTGPAKDDRGSLPTGVSVPSGDPVLKKWSPHTARVTMLQKLLRWFLSGSTLQVDGDYGPETHMAVLRAQLLLGVAADGEYGPATAAAFRKRFL